MKMPVGNLYSSDTFYDAAGRNARFGKMGVMAVEMEAAGLYCTAAYTGKRALAICSISDNLVTGRAPPTSGRPPLQHDEDRARGRGQDGEQRIRSVFPMRVIDIENITEAMRDDTRFVLRCGGLSRQDQRRRGVHPDEQEQKPLVCLTGPGGKTTTAMRLKAYLENLGVKVPAEHG